MSLSDGRRAQPQVESVGALDCAATAGSQGHSLPSGQVWLPLEIPWQPSTSLPPLYARLLSLARTAGTMRHYLPTLPLVLRCRTLDFSSHVSPPGEGSGC